MELKQFISETLIQIIEGVADVQELARRKGALVSPDVNSPDSGSILINPRGQLIEFDVAITTSENIEGIVKAGVFVGGFGLGSQGKGESQSQTLSHIKFSIPLYLPPQR